MSFRLLPAGPSDAHDMATIFWDAFITDPFVGLMGANAPLEGLYAYTERGFQRDIARATLEGLRYFKVVDDDRDKMVAFAKWQYPHSLTEEQRAKKEALSEGDPLGVDAPEGFNRGVADAFFREIHEKYDKWVHEGKDYFLNILAVSPPYQRKGLGSLLIRDGLALADRDGARTYIEASPAGLQLYLRHGWNLVDDIAMDLRPFGGKGMASEKILMRAPNSP